jgi:hypothetical protein
MILLGCLLAFGIAVAPRFFLILAWIFSERWQIVWKGDWLIPLLGIVFLPFTTVMYMLAWSPTGIQGWDWLWIILGLFLDLTHWAQVYQNKNNVPGTPMYTGGSTGI